MNSEKTNVLTSYPDRPLLNLSGKTVLKRTHTYIYIYIYIYFIYICYVALSNLSIYYIRKKIKVIPKQ